MTTTMAQPPALADRAGEATARRGTHLVDETFPATDFYALDDLLTTEERAVRDRVRAFVDAEVRPIIAGYWERGAFPAELVPGLRGLGVMGGAIGGHGCPGLSAVADGLVAAELARGDASVATFHAVHSGLAMGTVARCGSEEQRARWLPAMARLERVGAFALTEPAVGSDAAHLQTRARRDGAEWVLDGAKRWIGNGSAADILVVWARDDEGKVGAFVVERPAAGLTAAPMAGKTGLRALDNADLTLRGVRVPLGHRLAESRDFRDTARVLTATRYGVACLALGVAMGAYEAAVAYTIRRQQFGKPIAGFQLVQQKLATMLAEITAMQLLCWRLGRLLDEGRATAAQASLAKGNNAAKARGVVAAARDLLGGNGLLLDNVVARHHADIEAIYSYEGSDHIQTLIVGRAITGIAAFG